MERARQELGVEFEVSWHPYFLDLSLPQEGLSKRESYMRKGMDEAKLAKMERKMIELFSAEGIKYTLDGAIGNTLDSHRLASWTWSKYGAETQDRLVDALFRRYFSEGQNPADRTSLVGAAIEAGIDALDAAAFLQSGIGRQETLQAAAEAWERARGVPHYFLTVEGTKTDERPQGLVSQVPGAQDTETLYLLFRTLVNKAKGAAPSAKL